MLSLPERDRHAEALAAKIIDMTLCANADIRDFYRHHDYNGASTRELMWKESVIEACTQFNKDMARIVRYNQKQIADLVAVIPGPFVLKPMPENE